MDKKELDFAVFCAESVAEYLDMHCRNDTYLAEEIELEAEVIQ